MYKKPAIARGGRALSKGLYGGLRPEVQPPTPSYIRSRVITPANIPCLIENKVTPVRIPSIDKLEYQSHKHSFRALHHF